MQSLMSAPASGEVRRSLCYYFSEPGCSNPARQQWRRTLVRYRPMRPVVRIKTYFFPACSLYGLLRTRK